MSNLIIFSISFVVNLVLLVESILDGVISKQLSAHKNPILCFVFFLGLSIVGLIFSIHSLGE